MKSSMIGFYVSLAVVVWMQFQRAFETYFYVAGYTGAYQTRYYLCVLPILAFIAVYLLQMLTAVSYTHLDVYKRQPENTEKQYKNNWYKLSKIV